MKTHHLKLTRIVLALLVTALTPRLNAQDYKVYNIDAISVGKEIVSGDFGMGTNHDTQGHSFSVNNYYMIKDGKPWFPVMGELQYSRYPRNMWEDAILKMKSGGLDIIATYAFWLHHEEVKDEFDFSGRRDLRAFIELCKKHDMKVLLRIGPWGHGEVRNGAFPDWVQSMPSTRSNDPEYLKYVKRIYTQYYKQCDGLLFKDDGPIVGIQLENEYGGDPSHIVELKRLAREVGFDVPYYTVTGWNNVRIPDKEVLPVQAGYADAAWYGGTQQLAPNEQFLFMTGIPINTGVGTDVLPVLEVYGGRTYNPSDYPWLTAELGLGMFVGMRRRPVITRQDALSLSIVKLAGGANCLGYYMYHGGTNPQGKLTTLEEPGCAKMSYDFQPAVGEFGETNSKYMETKLIHYWLHDFGEQLCSTIPAMPQERPTGVEDVETFRCMTRTDGTSGYLFFSNYQRYVENKDLGIQINMKLKQGNMLIPNKPIVVPKDCAGIWAVNLNMSNNVKLKYATTQLICKVPSEDGDTYFFFAHDGLRAEYSFDANSIKRVIGKGSRTEISKVDGQYVITLEEPGKNAVLEVEATGGRKLRICTLNKDEAMQMFRFKDLWGQPRLVMADGDVLIDGNSLYVQRIAEASGDVRIFPSPKSMSIDGKKIKLKRDGIWRKCSWALPEKNIDVELTKTDEGYELSVPSGSMQGVYDVFLDFDWTGNVLEAYKDGKLFSDYIYYGPHFRPSVKHWGTDILDTKVKIKSSPISSETKCYIEPMYRPDFSKQDTYSDINKITPLPQYRVVLEAK